MIHGFILKALIIYNIKMTKVNNNNDIIVAENHNNIIIPNSVGITESGLWNIFLSKDTGKKIYKPRDPDYFNKYYHEHKKEIVCDICGKTVLKKIQQHQRTNKCRLTHYIQKDEIKLNEK